MFPIQLTKPQVRSITTLECGTAEGLPTYINEEVTVEYLLSKFHYNLH